MSETSGAVDHSPWPGELWTFWSNVPMPLGLEKLSLCAVAGLRKRYASEKREAGGFCPADRGCDAAADVRGASAAILLMSSMSETFTAQKA